MYMVEPGFSGFKNLLWQEMSTTKIVFSLFNTSEKFGIWIELLVPDLPDFYRPVVFYVLILFMTLRPNSVAPLLDRTSNTSVLNLISGFDPPYLNLKLLQLKILKCS